MGMEKLGIKETKDLVRFGLSLGKGIQEAMEDGKIDLLDAMKFLPVLKDLKPAIEGAKEIPAELKDMDDEERAELLDFFQKEFDLEDDELELKVEAGLQVALSLLQLALGFLKK